MNLGASHIPIEMETLSSAFTNSIFNGPPALPDREA